MGVLLLDRWSFECGGAVLFSLIDGVFGDGVVID